MNTNQQTLDRLLDKDLIDDMLVCKICGKLCKNFRNLSLHITKIHKNEISLKKYYDDYLKKDINEGKCLGINNLGIKCEKETTFNGLRGYQKYCSSNCISNSKEVKEKKRLKSQEKYGTDNPSQAEEVKKLINETNQDKYGGPSPYSSKEIRDKGIVTCLENNGVENGSQSPEAKEKKRLKSQEKYGTDFPFQAEQVINLVKQINLEKNIKDPDRPKKILEKMRLSFQKHYGEDNPMKCKEVINKLKNTIKENNKKDINRLQKILEKYENSCIANLGVKNASQSPEIKELKIETSQTNCKKDYWSQTDEGKLFHRNDMKRLVELRLRDNKKYSPRKGKNENSIFIEIKKHIDCSMISNQQRFGYWPDELTEEEILKIDWEVDGADHEFPKTQKKDRERDAVFIKNGYMPLRIKEKDWFEDKELQIIKIQETIRFLKQVQQMNQ